MTQYEKPDFPFYELGGREFESLWAHHMKQRVNRKRLALFHFWGTHFPSHDKSSQNQSVARHEVPHADSDISES